MCQANCRIGFTFLRRWKKLKCLKKLLLVLLSRCQRPVGSVYMKGLRLNHTLLVRPGGGVCTEVRQHRELFDLKEAQIFVTFRDTGWLYGLGRGMHNFCGKGQVNRVLLGVTLEVTLYCRCYATSANFAAVLSKDNNFGEWIFQSARFGEVDGLR